MPQTQEKPMIVPPASPEPPLGQISSEASQRGEPVPAEPMVVAPPQVVPAAPKEPWFSGNRAISLILSVVVLVVAGTAAFLFYARKAQKPLNQVMIAPTPMPIATPMPLRIPSAIATQSAFLSLEAQTASLSGDLQMYQVQDPSLSPPVMDLPLGFSQ